MRVSDLKARFEDPAWFRWVPLGALRAGEFLSCIDGRHDDHVISGPGGDIGEAILLLGVIEAYTGEQLERDTIYDAMSVLMDWHPRFYMHTDELSIDALEAALEHDPRLAPVHDLMVHERLADILQRPPHDLREALLEYVMRPEFTGCGHLRQLLEHPQQYELRLELVESVIRKFFRRMWDGSPSAQFEVLKGVHNEAAVISIEVDGAAEAGLFVPAVSGVARPAPTFVNHRPAREYMRKSFLDALERQGIIHDLPDDIILERCTELGARQLEATIGALAPTLPRFTVHFGESHIPAVVQDE